MLAKPDAFKARARARTAYTADVAAGRPVVAAARETEAMVAELLRWAAQMPPFAREITGAPARRARPAALAHRCHAPLGPGTMCMPDDGVWPRVNADADLCLVASGAPLSHHAHSVQHPF